MECSYLRQGYKRGRKNETVAKLLVEQEERRNSSFGTNTNGHLGAHDMISGPSSSGGQNQWMPPTDNSPGLMMDWTNHDSLTPNHHIRHPDGHVPSPAITGASIKSPMTVGFPALDDIVTLDHVRHLISLFFVHVSTGCQSEYVLMGRYIQSYQYCIVKPFKRISTTEKIGSSQDLEVSRTYERRQGMYG